MDVKRRSVLAAGAAGAAGLAATLGGVTDARAATAQAGRAAGQQAPASDSLRDLAAAIGLRVGSAIIPQDLNTPAWAAVAASQFSVVTPGNEMKWQVVEPTQGNFDWSRRRQPDGVREGQQPAGPRAHAVLAQPAARLADHRRVERLDQLVAAARPAAAAHLHRGRPLPRPDLAVGRLQRVHHRREPARSTRPTSGSPTLGPGVIADAFRWARQADPHALLFYNDYNIGGEDGTNAKADAAYALAQQLLDQHVPIDGIGIQGHLDTQYGWSPQRLQEDIERYASLGLKVAITEADVRTFVNNATDQVPTDNLSLFAQPFEFSEMLKAGLAVPEFISFTVWGFTDADSWVPGFFTGEGYATIYDVNLNPKPAYYALQSDLAIAAHGAPRRVRTYSPRA